MTTFTSWDAELYHHGILGMKWGVRRFQNKDGSLTPAGEKRYLDLTSRQDNQRKMYDDYVGRQKSSAGVYTKNGNEYIRKGSIFQRMTDPSEKIDARRKYVSITPEDNRRYSEYAGAGLLNNKDKTKIAALRYEAKKDLKVAGEKEVSDYILNKYGTDDLKNAYSAYQNQRKSQELLFSKEFSKLSRKEQKLVKTVNDDYMKNQDKIYNFLEKTLARDEATSSDIFKHFSSKGYDVIVDMQDSMSKADFPLILLNPSISVRNKKD